MKTCVLLNRKSALVDRGETIVELAGEHGVPVRRVASKTEVEQETLGAARDGCERIILAGGDGTISLAINALAGDAARVEMAVLPLGTGNDFARSLGISIDRPQLAWHQALEGRAVEVDLGYIERDSCPYFLNAANGGLGGLVARDVRSEDKARWGSFAYWMTALSELIDLQEYEVTLVLDQQTIEMPMYGVAVANGRFIGGGFPVAPHARLNDGLFDVIATPVVPTLDLLAAGMDFWMGHEQQQERIRVFRSRRVHVRAAPQLPFSVDGEPTQTLEAIFEVLPRAARFVVGENPPAVPVDSTPDVAQQ